MNTLANTTRQSALSATAGAGSRVRSLRIATRRIAEWWSDDAMSAQFSSARERDQRLLRRSR
jgi:chorismate-pyruvate lyase